MKRKFVVIANFNEDIIECVYVTDDYFKAVGKLFCLLTDIEDEKLEDGYIVSMSKDFIELEAETGYAFDRVYKSKDGHERTYIYYLLYCDEKEKE